MFSPCPLETNEFQKHADLFTTNNVTKVIYYKKISNIILGKGLSCS